MKAYKIVQVYLREEEILKNLISNKPYRNENTAKGDVRLLDSNISDQLKEEIYIEYKDKLNKVRIEIDEFLSEL